MAAPLAIMVKKISPTLNIGAGSLLLRPSDTSDSAVPKYVGVVLSLLRLTDFTNKIFFYRHGADPHDSNPHSRFPFKFLFSSPRVSTRTSSFSSNFSSFPLPRSQVDSFFDSAGIPIFGKRLNILIASRVTEDLVYEQMRKETFICRFLRMSCSLP